jgi:hypothetical protein
VTNCIKPLRAEIAALESGGAGGYATRHAEYNGVSAHLVELQRQRAALSSSGQGVAQAWTADDRFVAWVFGITEEQANRIKWLIFTLIFDVLSLAFRVVSALLMEGNSTGAVKRKLIALIDAGISPRQAVSMLDGEAVSMNMQPAGVKLPALDTGGRIETDGIAELHAGEVVLNAKATAELDRLHPGLADKLNAGKAVAPAPAPAPAPTPAPTSVNEWDICNFDEFDYAEHGPEWYDDEPPEPQPSKTAKVLCDSCCWYETKHCWYSNQTKCESYNTPLSDWELDDDSLVSQAAPAPAPAHVPRNVPRIRDTNVPRNVTREHVPMHLSGMAAKGRKGLIDTCPTCKGEFVVMAWNKVFCCDDCAAQANGFTDAGTRKTAWAKSKHSAA